MAKRTKVLRVSVPARAYDAMVAFINRHKLSKRPLKRLPAGVPGDGRSCPCAKACPGTSFGRDVAFDDGRASLYIPNVALKFIDAFDDRGYDVQHAAWDGFGNGANRLSRPVLPVRGGRIGLRGRREAGS